MAKTDNTFLIGAAVVGGLGVLFLFKDEIVRMIGGGGAKQQQPPLSLEDDMPPNPTAPTLPTGPQLPQPNRPQLTYVEYKFGMDYYATRIAEEIDRNSITGINRTTKLNIKGNVLLHYKSELKAIIDLQDRVLGAGPTSLNEKSLKIFAGILLAICGRMGIELKPEAKLRFQKQAAGKYVLALKGIIVS